MEKKLIKRIGSVCFSIILLFGVFVPMANCENSPEVNWKFQLCCPSVSPEFLEQVGMKRTPDSIKAVSSATLGKELARAVMAKTNGKFKIKTYSAGELFSVPRAYQGLEKGAIDMWVGPAWAFSGRNPIGFVSGSLPYSIKSHEEAYDIMFKTKFRDVVREAYKKNNIFYLTASAGGADGICSKFPIRTIDDLKGKKIRGGGVKGKVLKALGAVDVKLSPREIYTALQRGLIEGACMPNRLFGQWGFFEYAKYVSYPSVFGNYWVDVACNLEAWNSLPKEYQVILQDEADKIWKWALKTLLPSVEKYVQEKWSKKGVQYITLSDENLNEFKKAVYPIWDELAAMSPSNAEVVEIFRNYLKVD